MRPFGRPSQCQYFGSSGAGGAGAGSHGHGCAGAPENVAGGPSSPPEANAKDPSVAASAIQRTAPEVARVAIAAGKRHCRLRQGAIVMQLCTALRRPRSGQSRSAGHGHHDARAHACLKTVRHAWTSFEAMYQPSRRLMMACVNSSVPSSPPRSRVFCPSSSDLL